jgi:6-phosphogluconolactonase
MSVELQIVEDPAACCAGLLLEAAGDGAHIVLTGGSTPRAAYQRAATDPDRWTGSILWFGDERCVAPDDERSNFRMVRDVLLGALGARVSVHRMEGERGPEEGARAYEVELRDAGPPRFDLLLLGMGSDGHAASLFPDQESLSERERLVVGVPQAGLEPFVPRISLSVAGLALAQRILFLVTGSSKADAVAAAFGPDAVPDPHVPASLVPGLVEKVTVLLDSDAAARL